MNLMEINYFLQLQIQIPIIFNALLILVLVFKIQNQNRLSPLTLFPFYLALNITYSNLWDYQLLFFIDILLKYYIFSSLISSSDFSQFFLKKIGFTVSIFILIHIIYAYFSLFIDNSKQQNLLFSNYFLGVFDNPTKFTNYCMLFFPLILKNCSISNVLRKKDFLTILNLIIILLLTYILIKNNSRINLIFLSVICFFRLKISKIYLDFKRTLLTLAIIILSILTMNLFVIKKDSLNGRFLILNVTKNIINSNFWTGSGFNTYETKYNEFQGNYFAKNQNDYEILLADDNYVAHNEFLQTFAELGIVGLSISLIVAFYIFKNLNEKKINFYTLPKFDFIIILIILCLFSYPFRISETNDAIFLNILILFPSKNKYEKKFSTFNKKSLSSSFTAFFSIILLSYTITYQYELYTWYNRCIFHFKHKKNTKQQYFLINHNKNFLYSEAVLNLREGKYTTSLSLLEKLEKIRKSTNICMLKAQVYKQLDKPIFVLKEYQKASNINPKLLKPKYEIMKYYKYLNETQNAKLWAIKIIKTPIKINTFTTEFIKERAVKVLSE